MTEEQAGQIKALSMAATVQRPVDHSDPIELAAAVELEKLFLRHLLPLPYERTLTRVQEYVATHKWCSTLDELLDACDVPHSVRRDLFRAAQEGAEFWPSLRGSGWEIVGKDEPLPRGVGEWFTNLELPIPEGRHVDRALTAPIIPKGRALLLGPPNDVRDAINALSTRFQTSTRAIVAVQERRIPGIPVELLPAYEKLQRAMVNAETAERSHAEYADEYRRRLAELIEDASPADLPIEAVKPAAVRLLKRLVEYGGDVAAVEVLGCVWDLRVEQFETAPKDRFAGEPPTRVRAVLGESGESR